jgi:hypothetical protein
MDLSLALKLVPLLIENASAISEIEALVGVIKTDIEGGKDVGNVPVEEYVADLIGRAKTIATALQS